MTYRLTTDLTYPSTAAAEAELRAAADLPEADRQAALTKIVDAGLMKTETAGAIVADLPDGSIPWLLAQGLIELVVIEKPASTKPGKRALDAPAAPAKESRE